MVLYLFFFLLLFDFLFFSRDDDDGDFGGGCVAAWRGVGRMSLWIILLALVLEGANAQELVGMTHRIASMQHIDCLRIPPAVVVGMAVLLFISCCFADIIVILSVSVGFDAG